MMENSLDEIIELYKRDVDLTLLDENLRGAVEQRLQALQDRISAESQQTRSEPCA